MVLKSLINVSVVSFRNVLRYDKRRKAGSVRILCPFCDGFAALSWQSALCNKHMSLGASKFPPMRFEGISHYLRVVGRGRLKGHTLKYLSTVISVERGSHGPNLALGDRDLKLSHTWRKEDGDGQV